MQNQYNLLNICKYHASFGFLQESHFIKQLGSIFYSSNIFPSKFCKMISNEQSESQRKGQSLKNQESIISLLHQLDEISHFHAISSYQDQIKMMKDQIRCMRSKKSKESSSKQEKQDQQHFIRKVIQLCDECLSFIDSELKNSNENEELSIYYMNKKAEFQREKLQYAPAKQDSLNQIQRTYLQAYNLIKNSENEEISQQRSTQSMKLILNYSLFIYQIRKDQKRADQIVNQILQNKNLSLISDIQPFKIWQFLQKHYQSIKKLHLKTLLSDQNRNQNLFAKFQSIIFDFSHEKITLESLKQFKLLYQNANLSQKIEGLFNGKDLNFTENRAVLHTALRAPINSQLHHLHKAQMKQIMQDIHKVLKDIEHFSEKVRHGQILGVTGKKLQNLIVIGIGGSYLSIEFVYEALRSHPQYKRSCNGRKIRFLANVDPIDFDRAKQCLDPQSTLILVNSKTFTTAQTMLNARSCKQWLFEQFKKKGIQNQSLIVSRHFCACSTNLKELQKFSIPKQNVFAFWDFVGGRFSVWSCIGILPLSIHFGFKIMKDFLQGGHSIDRHFLRQQSLQRNIPLLLGMIGFYRTTIQGYTARAIIPYCQALCKFSAHVQQLDMESNGKRVNSQGEIIDFQTAVTNFGEPGTNGQHSFFQLLHQGRQIPVQFIGFTKSQQPFALSNEVSNHDELMSNFFSQPDALALGKSREQLIKEGVSGVLLAHKEFSGNRPSSSLLFLGELNAYSCGQLLALYEHRTSVQGFLWDINSYDQYGVQLGKILAKNVRQILKNNGKNIDKLVNNSASKHLIQRYIQSK